MFRIYIPLAVSAAIALWPSSGSAAPDPRACLPMTRDLQGPLPRMDVDNVVYRSVPFRRDRMYYVVETFSDMAQAGDQLCFRWEVVNSSMLSDQTIDPPPSGLTIDELIWPVAGIRAVHALPGVPEYNNLRDRSDARNDSNPVHLFEGTPDLTNLTQSWIPTRVTNAPAKSPIYDYKRGGELLPALKANPSILNSLVAIISFGEERSPPEAISQTVGYSEVELQVLSHVMLENNTLMISTNVAASHVPSPEVRIKAITLGQTTRLSDIAPTGRLGRNSVL